MRHLPQQLVRQWLLANLPLLWQKTPPRGWNRLRFWWLRRALRLADRRFERQFMVLLHHSVPASPSRRNRPLLVASIGTLGPGGAERQLVNTLLGLKARYDIDIEVVAMYLEDESHCFFLNSLENAGITVSRVDRNGGLAIPGSVPAEAAQRLGHAVRTHLHPDLEHVSAYASVFLARRPDIVHLWLDEVNTKGGLAAVLAGVPRVVLGMRSVNPSHFSLYQPYMRAAYRCLLDLPQVTALNNSETGARDYAEWLGVEANRISVLRNGFEVDGAAAAQTNADPGAYRARWNIPESAPVLGGVMRLSEEKRPLLWVDVAEAVAARCPDAHFLLVGNGVQRPLVDARIAASRFADRFHLIGHQQNPYDSLLAMSVLFLSSVFEGSPNVLIEAQAVGVPVVTMPAGGAVEVVDDGRTGWVVRDGTAAGAAERIAYLMTHRHELSAAGAVAPDWVRARFGLERMISETATLYGGLQPLPSEITATRPAPIGA
jgi:glycosyltransferase involved in cell wall biosynthesis